MEHILKAKACQGTLLRFIVGHEELPLANVFPGVDEKLLPEKLRIIQKKAQEFADFMYIIHLRYNCIYSQKNGKKVDETILDKFYHELKEYKKKSINIETVLDMVTLRENSSKLFCREAEKYLLSENYFALDDCIERRERRIKGSRRKGRH